MFKTISASSPIVFWEQNLKTNKLVIRGDWKGLCGWTVEELRGRDVARFLAAVPEDLVALQKMKDAVSESGADASASVEVRIRRKDGEVIWAQDICYARDRDEHGKALTLSGVLQEITAVKNIVASATQKQEKLDLIANIAKLSYWEWDARRDTLTFSKQLEAILGYADGEINKMGVDARGDENESGANSWLHTIHPSDRAQARLIIKRYLSGTIDKNSIELRMRKKDGSYIWVVTVAYIAERDERGLLSVMRGALIDIDTTKLAEIQAMEYAVKLELNKEHMDIVAEMSHLTFFEWDIPEDKFIYTPHFANEFGYAEGEIRSFGSVPRPNPTPPYSYVELIHPDDLARRNHNMEQCLSGATDHYYADIRLRHKNGKYLWAKAAGHVSECKDGKPVRLIGGIVNINDLRQAEELSRAKSAFLARMSHEIRTPMNAITGMSELILRENIPPRAREYAASVQQASANLLSLINDILDFSKIEAGSMPIVNAPYLFASLINDVVNIIRMRVREKPVAFTVNLDAGIPQKLVGDIARVRQVLLNLLTNAVKYTDEGYIAFDIAGTRYKENDMNMIRIQMKVGDSGKGIKNTDLGRLFGDFVQVDTEHNRNIEGTGLGLAIAKNLARAMNGDITVESEYGRGSVFTFAVPQLVADEGPLARVDEPLGKNVLVYASPEQYAVSIRRTLENLRVPCAVVGSYQQLKDELERRDYSHFFTASPLYESARELIRKTNAKTKIVALGDGADSVNADTVISYPAHVISIANILNNVTEEKRNESDSKTFGFIAPSARVLVIDDIVTNLVVAEGLLAPYQTHVDTCLSGEDALTLIKALAQKDEYFDVIYIDHMMPGMDGIETAKAIRALAADGFGERFNTIPLIAFTANAIIGMRDIFIENGFNDYVVKPIDIKKLDESMRAAIPRDKWLAKPRLEETPKRGEKDLKFMLREIASIHEINIREALSHVGTEANLVEVLRRFTEESHEYEKDIQKSFEHENWPGYTIKTHALKGVLATIGNAALSEKAKELELAAREERYDVCRAKTAALLAGLAAFRAALEKTAVAVSGKKPEKTAVSAETFLKKARELRDAAFAFSSDDAERLAGELSALAPRDDALQAAWEKAAPAIYADIKDFLYDEAATALRLFLEDGGAPPS